MFSTSDDTLPLQDREGEPQVCLSATVVYILKPVQISTNGDSPPSTGTPGGTRGRRMHPPPFPHLMAVLSGGTPN